MYRCFKFCGPLYSFIVSLVIYRWRFIRTTDFLLFLSLFIFSHSFTRYLCTLTVANGFGNTLQNLWFWWNKIKCIHGMCIVIWLPKSHVLTDGPPRRIWEKWKMQVFEWSLLFLNLVFVKLASLCKATKPLQLVTIGYICFPRSGGFWVFPQMGGTIFPAQFIALSYHQSSVIFLFYSIYCHSRAIFLNLWLTLVTLNFMVCNMKGSLMNVQSSIWYLTLPSLW